MVGRDIGDACQLETVSKCHINTRGRTLLEYSMVSSYSVIPSRAGRIFDTVVILLKYADKLSPSGRSLAASNVLK